VRPWWLGASGSGCVHECIHGHKVRLGIRDYRLLTGLGPWGSASVRGPAERRGGRRVTPSRDLGARHGAPSGRLCRGEWRLAVGDGGYAVLAVPCGRAAVPGRGRRKTGSGLWWPTADGLWWPAGLLAPMGRL
jgi:hypothetical protein